MLTLAQVGDALVPWEWFTSLDLTNVFWHVPFHPRFRSFLTEQDGSTVLRFRVLPFGLNITTRVFMKITKTVATLLADQGICSLMYLDDWLFQVSSPAEAQKATERTFNLCSSLGFLFNIPSHP